MTAISIVVPHFNQPDYLERCLASLAPQIAAYGNADLIVVDNGSRELPTGVVKRYPFAKLDQELEKGPGPARNHGVQVSKGNLLAFIDADCVAHPEWLQSVAKAFAEHPDYLVIGGDVRIGLVDKSHPTALEAYESVFAYRQEEYIRKHNFSGTGNLAMRRGAFETVGAFAGIGIAEDRDWGQRATSAGLVIHYVPEMIVYHPARTTFAELTRKWDRHIAHDFNEKARGASGRVKWLLLMAAVAASAVIDVRRVAASDRISSMRERLMASAMLFKIRMYRAWKMSGLLFQRGEAVHKWNS
jgi:GT2 family glycosyltransferase